jgi:hypothetical protein
MSQRTANDFLDAINTLNDSCRESEKEAFRSGLVAFLLKSNDDELLNKVLTNVGNIAASRINRLNREIDNQRTFAGNVLVRTDEMLKKSRPTKLMTYPHLVMSAALVFNPKDPECTCLTTREHVIIYELITHLEGLKSGPENILQQRMKYLHQFSAGLHDFVAKKLATPDALVRAQPSTHKKLKSARS